MGIFHGDEHTSIWKREYSLKTNSPRLTPKVEINQREKVQVGVGLDTPLRAETNSTTKKERQGNQTIRTFQDEVIARLSFFTDRSFEAIFSRISVQI